MLSIIEISIAGDAFLFYNNMSPQILEKIKLLSEQFRKQGDSLRYAETKSIIKMFCSEVKNHLGQQLQPVAVAAVITLK